MTLKDLWIITDILRTFINTVVEGFATSPEGIDQLRKRSVLVQTAILSVDLPEEVVVAVKSAYKAICGFDSKMCNNSYNYIPNLSKSEILQKIKEK